MSKVLARALSGLVLIAAITAQAHAVNAPAVPAKTPDLSNAACQKCHATGQPDIKVPDGDEDTRKLRAVPTDRFKKSVHANLSCVSCHSDITDAKAKHVKATVKKVDCAQCHLDLLAQAKAENKADKVAAYEKIVKNVEAYRKSFHARPDADKPTQPKASCDSCHDTHTFNVPAKDTVAYKKWRQSIPNLCGDSCHTDHIEEWTDSAHGVKAQEKTDGRAAVCTDCHSSHDIINTSSDPFKLQNVKECGNCHEKEMHSYRDTYHGQVNKLGYTYTAKCKDCHGAHGILKAADPSSKVHPDNKLKTCKSCHDGKKMPLATAGFKSFGPHANTSEPDKYPQLYYVSHFMIALVIGVFAYFWLHCLLWWYREYKHHNEADSEMRIHAEEAMHAAGGKTHIRRFGPLWRLGHLCFAISVMILILTGITVLYADTAWAPLVAKAFGGPQAMGIVHRVAAAIMLSIFFLHILGVIRNIIRTRKTFRFFGPESLVPRWQDFKDAWGMFKWFANKGPRPTFDRWTYWEKFDYWAVFWGMTIIGTSGLMLWFPAATASILPGWVFNVATLVHGEEAFLAAVFLFTVHFFNNHFRPDKYPPPDIVMFTGAVSLEEFAREHTLEYQRLLASGELQKYLVDAPPRPMTLGSRILGITLIAIGLTLLMLVLIGFVRA